jgi:hypothetical protein
MGSADLAGSRHREKGPRPTTTTTGCSNPMSTLFFFPVRKGEKNRRLRSFTPRRASLGNMPTCAPGCAALFHFSLYSVRALLADFWTYTTLSHTVLILFYKTVHCRVFGSI